MIMKKLLFLLSAYLLLSACSENEEIVSDLSIATRAIVDENNASLTNPDLINNWENLDVIYLNTEKSNGDKESVTAPWANGSSSPLSETFRYDIKKEDGWKMLFHTFKGEVDDKMQNYMCFYNQFTGFIKVFYYYEGKQKSQGAQWYVKTDEGENIKLLDEPAYLTLPDATPASNNMLLISNMNSVPTTGIEHGWNGFEFQVPRYSTDLTSMELKIGAYEKHITDYNFLGKETLNTVGTITTDKQESSKISTAIANVAGPEAKKFIDNLGDNVFGDAVILGQKISDLIKNISDEDYSSIFRKGLDLIFGKTTSTTTYDVYLTTTGTIEMSGTSSTETTAGIPILNFNLYDILNPTASNANPDFVTASVTTTGGHHLGVWTLKENPKVYYDRMALLSNVQKTQSSVSGEIYLPQIVHYDLEPIINPDILPYIKSYNFSVDFIICDKLEGEIRLGQDINTIYMNNPLLYSDENTILKEIPEKKRYPISGLIDIDSYNNGVAFWYDWGKVIDGRLVAVVSLNMTCQYEGKETNVYQSRVYDVDYGVDTTLLQPEQVHFPPSSVVINYGKSYTGTQFGWYDWFE